MGNFRYKIKMQTKVAKSIFNRACQGGLTRMISARPFSNSVTYEMKDLILDPAQKG